MHMCWHDLLFIHWPVRPAVIESLLPPGLMVDTFDGWAWIGVVPFRMSNVRPRYLPGMPGASTFPELNVRTYVKTPGRGGVWFFSLDAASRIAVRAARAWFGLPYYDASMDCSSTGESLHYRSVRIHRNASHAEFRAAYQPVGPVYRTQPGTLDHWLTERYCLYMSPRRGRIGYGDIHHSPWPLQPAEAEIQLNTMTEPLGLSVPQTKPALHFARLLDVVAWNAVRLPRT
jgi:uncharacterized protein